MTRTRRDHSWAAKWWAGIKEEALGRDRKPGSQPPGWFKRIRRRLFRAKCKQALRNGKELPVEKNSNVWDWN